tara:strand:- start:250 stop:1173 length:924 start_codon:yes stop_codon:yes gene_type:complete
MDNQTTLLKVNSSGYDSVDNLILPPWYTTELSDNVRPPWLVQVNNNSSDPTFRYYDPMSYKNIAIEFYQLSFNPTLSNILNFMSQWGFLDNPYPLIDEWSTSSNFIGESLYYWRYHLILFSSWMQLWKLIDKYNHSATYLSDFPDTDITNIEKRISWSRDYRKIHYKYQYTDPYGTSLNFSTTVDPITLKEMLRPAESISPGSFYFPALYVLKEEVSAVLTKYVHVGIDLHPHQNIRLYSETLLGAIYLHFALAILGGVEKQAFCENTFCKYGRFFIKKRRDQRFCSKMCREQAFYYTSKSKEVLPM